MLEGSILKKLAVAHQKSNNPLNLGVYYKNTLVALCHALEDFILESQSAPIMVTAFQRGKWYLEEADRYKDLATKAAHITIMATPDSGFHDHETSKKPNVSLIDLEANDPVGQEWHLMIFSDTYAAMVLCQELSDEDYGSAGQPEEDLKRKFYGFWTFEPELVKETVELAIDHIKGYNKELAAQLTEKLAIFPEESEAKDDLGEVVSRVVKYLQSSRKKLSHPEEPSVNIFCQELNDNLVSNKLQAFLRMAQLIERADDNNPNATREVAALAEAMGQLLDLPAWQIKRLRLAGLLHQLVPLQKASIKETKSSVLQNMPQLEAIANIISHQSEAWDGSGFPQGLAYDKIPLESRILRLTKEFQEHLNQYQRDKTIENPFTLALKNCQTKAGEIFDPKLIEALSLLVMGMQQGMSVSVSIPKIAAGIWLLEEIDERVALEKGIINNK